MRFPRTSAASLALLALAACGPPDLPEVQRLEGSTLDSAFVNDALPDQVTVGHRMMASGQYELALRAYTRAFAVADEGQTAELLLAIGSANAQLGRLWRARRSLERAVEVDPRSVTAWNNLGVVRMSLGDPIPALDAFQTADRLARGRNAAVRRNIDLATSRVAAPPQEGVADAEFTLVRQGSGRYLLQEQSD